MDDDDDSFEPSLEHLELEENRWKVWLERFLQISLILGAGGALVYFVRLEGPDLYSPEKLEIESGPTQTYQAKPLVNEDYTDELINQINRADTSVKILMYVVQPTRYDDPQAPVKSILSRLESRMEDGISVTMIVDSHGKNDPESKSLHQPIMDRLRTHEQFEGYIYPGPRTLHTKAVLIDHDVLITGAHNWTWSSLSETHETSLMVRSDGGFDRFDSQFEAVLEKSRRKRNQ